MKPMPPELDGLARGFMSSRALLSAVELDLFTAVGDGASADEVAARVGTEPRATARLLRALASLDLVDCAEGRFRCTEVSAEFLAEGGSSDSRASLLHQVNLWERWSTLSDCVRRGERVIDPARNTGPAWTRSFIGAMHRGGSVRGRTVATALAEAGLLAGARRVLDLGGGSGAYSHALLAAAEDLHVTLFDLPPVVELARGYAAEAGLAARMGFVEGDLRQGGWGDGYDLVLISSICHMLSAEENLDLLRRLRPALAPGGRVAISDFLLDEDRCGPRMAALFGLNMLVGTRGGDAYTESDYRSWLETAGYGAVRRLPLAGPADLVLGIAG